MSAVPSNTPSKSLRRKTRLQWFFRFGIFFMSFLFSTLILITEIKPHLGGSEFNVGEPSPRTFFSPFDLNEIDEASTEYLRKEAAAKVPPVYEVNPSIEQEIREKINYFFSVFSEAKELQAEGAEPPAVNVNELPILATQETVDYLKSEESLAELKGHLESLLESNLNRVVLGEAERSKLISDGHSQIAVLTTSGENFKFIREIPSLETVKESANNSIKNIIPKNRKQRMAALDVFNQVMDINLIFNEAETTKRRTLASEAVTPIRENIKKNELVVQRGMIVSGQQKKRLDMIQKELTMKKVVNKSLAIALLVFLTYLLGFLYMILYERKNAHVFQENNFDTNDSSHYVIVLSNRGGLARLIGPFNAGSFSAAPFGFACK